MKPTPESLNSGASAGTSRRTSASTSATDMLSQTVTLVPERRRYSTQRKLTLVRETYLPGNTVSSVARKYGITPSLLFKWRALDREGAMLSVSEGEPVVSAKQYGQALEEIKRLQRLLGKEVEKNAILEEAVAYARSKKWIAR